MPHSPLMVPGFILQIAITELYGPIKNLPPVVLQKKQKKISMFPFIQIPQGM